MFKKMVMATDLSPAWDEIVACAGEFKVLGVQEIVLTHIITVKFLAGVEEKLRAEAEPRVRAQAESLAAQGFQVCTEMLEGMPGYAVNDAARRQCADLIVVGPQKASRWQERILGSVAGAVLHRAELPVLFLKTGIKEGLPPGACRLQATELLGHVLFPTDFSAIAEGACAVVESLGPLGASQVTLLHALDVPGGEAYPPGFQEMAVAQAQASLAAWRERLLAAGLPQVQAIFDPGHPLTAILKVLQSQDISLIVMGTQGKGFIKEIFLGSVAHNVSRLALCPVLLIPPKSR
jgi:nucleotide-binding universal stress UspA family protein